MTYIRFFIFYSQACSPGDSDQLTAGQDMIRLNQHSVTFHGIGENSRQSIFFSQTDERSGHGADRRNRKSEKRQTEKQRPSLSNLRQLAAVSDADYSGRTTDRKSVV